jgi:hypothetical protein
MIQRLLLVLTCICSVWMLDAKPVSKMEAQLTAENFYKTTDRGNELGIFQLNVAQTISVQIYNESSGLMENIPLYYVFNVNSADGFVMVTADDAALPILGYATSGTFDPSIEATNYLKWVEGYKEQMLYIIENNLEPTEEISAQWKNLTRGVASGEGRNSSTVNALLGTIAWNQNGGGSPAWNDLCPSSSVVGCVATAMAQIMKYHSHPAQGAGFHSYNHSTYGTQSVNYGSTTYNWSAMPNTTSSTESAKLSYHCGVAVDMMYSPSGSGAYSSDAKDAFKDYFDYKSTVEYLSRSNYSDNNWKLLLKADLDNNLPMYYAGSGNGGGHAFVCDGYDVSDKFHYNWGWGGSYDGYFNVDALNPSGVGTGGGSGGFNSNHRVIRGIEPNGGGGGSGGGGGAITVDLQMYTSPILSITSPIQYGTTFSIDAEILNPSGSGAVFTGEIAAALLDPSNNFVSFIETKLTQSYDENFYYTRTFSSASMGTQPTPGTYNVIFYQKQTGAANWTPIANGGGTNGTSVVIQMTNSNGMELQTSITTSSTPLTLASAATVTTSFVNNSSNAYSGKFSMDLHDAQGNWVMLIEEISGTLPAGQQSAATDFTIASLTLPQGNAAGTYLLVAWILPDGGDPVTDWEIVGSGAYSNPTEIDIAEPGLSGDVYENNNTAATSNIRPINFFNDAATSATPGSNIHVGGDYDYYKIILPAGNSYSIDAQVLDSYNTSSGYDGDALFSYAVGGNTYSSSYDSDAPTINLPNGGILTFKVAAYYEGQTGSYEFRAAISRGPVAIQEVTEVNGLHLYPVPANKALTLEFEAIPEGMNQIEFFNALGQKIHSITGSDAQKQLQQISTSDWTNGTYWILLHANDAITRKTFVVTH